MKRSNGREGSGQDGTGAGVGQFHVLQPGVPVYDTCKAIPNSEVWVPELLMWNPIYVRDRGTMCLMSFEDGSQSYYGASSRWVRDSLLDFYDTNFATLRKKYIAYTGQSQSVPIPVQPRNLFFFAVKTRHTFNRGLGHNDGAYGYIANSSIRGVEPLGKSRVRVRLATHHQVDVVMNHDSFQKQRRNGEYFQLCLEKHGHISGREDDLDTALINYLGKLIRGPHGPAKD